MKILSNFSKKGKLIVLLIAILVMILGGIGIFIANNGSNSILGIKLPGIKGEIIDSETAQASSEKSTLEKAIEKNAILSETENIKVEDAYGNQVIVPAGFKVTNDATDVTGGVVIEDEDGNQFVWVPVGEVKDGTDSTHTITLSRYTFGTNGNPTNKGAGQIQDSWAIDLQHSEYATSSYGNATAKDINVFKTSTDKNQGYYVGRYEARTMVERQSNTNLTPVTEKGEDYVYTYITQSQASTQCQKMYTNENFTCDLINSYAWDTAIVFLQMFDDREETKKTIPYSRQKSLNVSFANKGTNNTDNPDKICNIYDMASNRSEVTTETSKDMNYGVKQEAVITQRGGDYSSTSGQYIEYTSSRISIVIGSDNNISFRPILYLEGSFSEYQDVNSGNTGGSDNSDRDNENQGDDPTPSQVVSAKEIANTEDKNDFYGKQVTNYTVDGIDVNWDIFYSDGTNIYLIADDYIERSKLPATKAGHKPNAGSSSYPRSAYFTNIMSDYQRF